MKSANPFDGRRKTYSGETIGTVKARLLEHRKSVHGTEDLAGFFDCAACGVLERRIDSLTALAKKRTAPGGLR